MADMERFYREARILASSANALAEEAQTTKTVTELFCRKYHALVGVSEPELLTQMRNAGVNADASPEIQGCLQRVEALRRQMGVSFDDVARRVVHG